MAGMFDDLVPAQQPVYGPGSDYTGVRAPAAQANSPYVQSRDNSAPVGSASNPSFDTPDLTGADSSYHVDQQGGLHGPAELNLNMFGDLVPGSGVGNGQVARLSASPAIRAALASDSARGPDASDPGSLNLINGFMLGRGPEFDAAGSYLDTALGNAMKRLGGKPVPYGASDAFAVTKAADQDRLASWQAAHPVQGAVTSGAGAALNPVNMLAAGALGRAFEGTGATAKLMGFGKSVVGSSALGAGEGAVYGSADPNDPAGGAARGALYGGVGGALAVPAGMAGAAFVRGLANAGRNMVAGPLASFGDAVRGLTPEQMSAVQALRTDMAGRGVDVSLPEAVQQVTNNGTPLGRMLRVLEGTKQGDQILAPYFANRTAQVQGAVRDFADRVAAPTELPSGIGLKAQRAAQGGLDEVRQNINAAADPYYKAMPGSVVPGPGAGTYAHAGGATRYVAGPGQAVPEGAYAPLAASEAYRQAVAGVRGDRLLNAGIAHLPDNDVSVVNEVVKHLDSLAEGAKQTAQNPSGNNYKASLYQGARDLADQIATLHSPQWRAARDTVSSGRQWLLDPLEAGPVGQIARTDSVPAQVGALYPQKPLEGAASETDAAMRVLNNQFPGVGADLTRQHLMMSLDGARPELQGGPNPYLGPAFAVKVAGSPERQAALMAGVRNVGPQGPALADDLGSMLEGLRATGRRQPAGSKTAFNEGDLREWQVPPAAKFLESFSLSEPLEPIAQILKSLNYKRNVNGLGQIFMSAPDETADLLARAQAAAPRQAPLNLPALPYNVTGVPALALRPPSPQR